MFMKKINHTPLLCNVVVAYVGHKCNAERVQRLRFYFVRETKGACTPRRKCIELVVFEQLRRLSSPARHRAQEQKPSVPDFPRPIRIIFGRIAESLESEAFPLKYSFHRKTSTAVTIARVYTRNVPKGRGDSARTGKARDEKMMKFRTTFTNYAFVQKTNKFCCEQTCKLYFIVYPF